MFTKEQISASLQATQLMGPILRATVIMDQEQLHSDILSALPNDPLFIAHQAEPQTQWSVTPDGFFRHDNLIYVQTTFNSVFSAISMTTFFPVEYRASGPLSTIVSRDTPHD